jgi:hypothetical protein
MENKGAGLFLRPCYIMLAASFKASVYKFAGVVVEILHA